MIPPPSRNAADLRRLAAQLRGHAAETAFNLYRRKFEGLAQELEEAARDADSRALSDGKARSG